MVRHGSVMGPKGLLWVRKKHLFNPLKIHYHLFLLFILIGENRVLMDKIGVKNRIKMDKM